MTTSVKEETRILYPQTLTECTDKVLGLFLQVADQNSF